MSGRSWQLELSLNYDPDLPIRVQDIAERQNIPVKFLFQIMQILKRVDIVRSKRGTDGEEITLIWRGQLSEGEIKANVGDRF